MYFWKQSIFSAVCGCGTIFASGSASALTIVLATDNSIREIDLATGEIGEEQTVLLDTASNLVGIEIVGSTLYGLNGSGSTNSGLNDGSLLTIDLASGQATTVGRTGTDIGRISEGSLAWDPTRDLFIGTNTGSFGNIQYFEIDPETGDADNARVASDGRGDFSGSAFTDAGELFLLRTSFGLVSLLEIDPNTGNTISDRDIDLDVEGNAGFDYDPVSGNFIVANFARDGVTGIYSVDPDTVEVELLLDTTSQNFRGIVGLAVVPTPGTASMFCVCALAAARRRR